MEIHDERLRISRKGYGPAGYENSVRPGSRNVILICSRYFSHIFLELDFVVVVVVVVVVTLVLLLPLLVF